MAVFEAHFSHLNPIQPSITECSKWKWQTQLQREGWTKSYLVMRTNDVHFLAKQSSVGQRSKTTSPAFLTLLQPPTTHLSGILLKVSLAGPCCFYGKHLLHPGTAACSLTRITSDRWRHRIFARNMNVGISWILLLITYICNRDTYFQWSVIVFEASFINMRRFSTSNSVLCNEV